MLIETARDVYYFLTRPSSCRPLLQHTTLSLYSRTLFSRLGTLRGDRTDSLIFKIANNISRKDIVQPLEETLLNRKDANVINDFLESNLKATSQVEVIQYLDGELLTL